MKKNTIILIIVCCMVAMIAVGYSWHKSNKSDEVINEKVVTEDKAKEPIAMCYSYVKRTDRGFYDTANLRLNLSGVGGVNVTGEYNNIPGEKDSKVGTFEGTAGPLNQKMMARVADLWWNSEGEGMKVKEELMVAFGDGSASIGAGEMVDRGDGVYVYKDKSKVVYNFSLSQTDCANLDETKAVESYVKSNIKTIATDKPVLGGSWYTISVYVSPATNSGEVKYEDGHIQSNATFGYVYDTATGKVTIKSFILKPEAKITYNNASEDLIVVSSPLPSVNVSKNFTISGLARGTWYFEASFPVEVLDKSGKSLVKTYAKAQSNWMTTNFVEFKSSINIPSSYSGLATVVLHKDNPSDMREKDASISFPIIIE